MHVGSITFSTALDNAQLEKDLSGLTKKIEKKEQEIADLTTKRDAAKEKGTLDAAVLDSEKAKLREIEKRLADIRAMASDKSFSAMERADAKALIPSVRDELTEQRTRVSALQAEWNKTQRAVEGYNAKLSEAESAMGRWREEAGHLIQEIDNAPSYSNKMLKEIASAKRELETLESQGKWFGDEEYDRAYQNLVRLTNEVKRYKAELSKTPEQIQREADKSAQQAEKIAAQEKEADRLREIARSAEVSDREVVNLTRELDELIRRQKDLESAGVGSGYKEYDKISQRISEINKELREYQKNLLKAAENAGKAEQVTKKSASAMERLKVRLKSLASQALVFTAITTALRSFCDWMGKVVKTNSETRQSIAQLKAALFTLAQPLVEIIIPAFVALVNVLTRVVTAVAQLVSALFGKTLKQSRDGAEALYKEASGIEAVGDAAESAIGSLAGFDEINTINTEDTQGAGGGGGSGDAIDPDFSWADDMGGMLDRLKEIADLVGLIAAGLALWQISKLLPGILGTIAQKLAGLLLTVGGLLLYWHGLTDAWENGVDWLNLIEMIGGLAAAALGLYLLFGPVAAGIALIVGGLGMLVTGFHDAMENGWNLQNVFLSIAGILAAGLGIAIITGSWIPLLIAGIASVLLALTVATGHGEELLDGIRSAMEGFADFFSGIFTGDIEKAVGGIEKIISGLEQSTFAIVDGLRDSILSFLGWLDEKTDGRFHDIIEMAKGFITDFFECTKEVLGDNGVLFVLRGLLKFLTGVFTQDWDLAWEGAKDIFKGAWNSVVTLLEGAVNLIIRGLNWLISQMNKIKFDVPSWVPAVGGKSIGINIPSITEAKIPRLAKGAVIPPNREFMAVLGDQTSGNNLEAPEGLIRKIVREESGGGSAELAQLLQAILNAVKEGHIIMVDGTAFGRTAIRTINSVNTAAGKQLLLI